MADLIKKIKLGENTYDIAATQVDASAIIGGEDNVIPESAFGTVPVSAITAVNESAISSIPASALKASALSGIELPWNSISALTAGSAATTTSGIMTPDQIQAAINEKVAGVYRVKGTHTAEVTEGVITNMPDDAVEGDVWNIALPEGVTSATLDGQTITDGDNVVYVKSGYWDKLAGAIDTTTFATTAWTTGYINSGATSATTTALWNDVTNYIKDDLGSANSANASALWTDIVSTVNSGISAQVWDKVITTKSDLSAIDSATSGNLVNAGAITGYIKDQIDSTIQETIDIAHDPIGEVVISGSGETEKAVLDYTKNLSLSAIPNVSAVGNFVDRNYIAKKDIRYDNEVLIIDNL